jgi:hypothetical protein
LHKDSKSGRPHKLCVNEKHGTVNKQQEEEPSTMGKSIAEMLLQGTAPVACP